VAKPLVVVLGASGLLGTSVARELACRPIRLRLVGRRPTAVPRDHVAEVEVRTIDLTAPGALADAVTGADAVVHLVAHITGAATWRVSEGDPTAEQVNLGLVRGVVDALRTGRPGKPPVVVFAGSMSQAGRSSSGRIDESMPDEPLTTYDRQKLAAERELKAATAEGVVRGVTLRLGTLFGRGAASSALDKGVVTTMMRRAFAGEPLTMWHDGTIKRDLLCADDAARAFVAALDHADALAGGHWLVGTGRATTVADLFTLIARLVSEVTGKEPVPVVTVEPPELSSATDLLDFVVDPSAFRRVSGWVPRVPLHEALSRTAAALAGGVGAGT
jgi:dTDP-4-keto-6-deoxyhexose 4-ketoreductase